MIHTYSQVSRLLVLGVVFKYCGNICRPVQTHDLICIFIFFLQVLEGLHYLHTKCKIIHTDIKPENVLLCVDEGHIRKIAADATYFHKMGLKLPGSAGKKPSQTAVAFSCLCKLRLLRKINMQSIDHLFPVE